MASLLIVVPGMSRVAKFVKSMVLQLIGKPEPAVDHGQKNKRGLLETHQSIRGSGEIIGKMIVYLNQPSHLQFCLH